MGTGAHVRSWHVVDVVVDMSEHKSICVSNARTLFLWMCDMYVALIGKSLICVCADFSVISKGTVMSIPTVGVSVTYHL